jgi:mannose-1-phosphate guanylyltransferase
LRWTFEGLVRNDISDVILAVSYRTEVLLKQHGLPRRGLRITYSRDPLKKSLGTGGSIKKAEKLIGHDDPFLVLNEDIFADVNYAEMFKVHAKRDAVATIALHEVDDTSRYGAVEVTKDNQIRRFVEKPRKHSGPSNLINAGVYVFDPRIFKYIPKQRRVSIEREVFPKLAEEGLLHAYIFTDEWMDIGKPEDYLRVNMRILDSTANQLKLGVFKSAEIKKPVAIDKKVAIGEGSTIGPYAVIGESGTIGKDVHIRNSIIFSGATISDSTAISGAIIGEDVKIGKEVRIQEGCIVGDQVEIKNKVTLDRSVSICPSEKISKSVLESTPTC